MHWKYISPVKLLWIQILLWPGNLDAIDSIHESIGLPEGQEEIYAHYCMVYIIVLYTCYIYLFYIMIIYSFSEWYL